MNTTTIVECAMPLAVQDVVVVYGYGLIESC